MRLLRTYKTLILAFLILLVGGGGFWWSATREPVLRATFSLSTAVAAAERPSFILEETGINPEDVEATLRYGEQVLNVVPDLEKTAEGIAVSIPPISQFKPGKYLLQLSYDSGRKREVVEQDFLWGVLAFNTYQSSYRVGETATLAYAVLDDLGITLCDAGVTAEITSPSGKKVVHSTANGAIQVSDICADKYVTDIPDYASELLIEEEGRYTVEVTAETVNGTRSLRDFFLADQAAVRVTRQASMRIYPPAEYKVRIDVQGEGEQEVVELVPNSFTISGISHGGELKEHTPLLQKIVWRHTLTAENPVTFSYTYKAPDISPQFYLLGPVSVGSFTESRPWQIAADEVSAASPNRLWSSGAELNSLTANMEITGSSGTTPTIDGTTKRSGDYAYRANTSSNTATIYKTFAASAQSGRYWYRAYVRVDTAPGTEMAFLRVGTSTNNKIGVRMNTDRTIELWNEEDSAQIGSASSALSLSTWYRVELFVDTTTLSSTDTTLKLDGTVVASSTAENLTAGQDRLTWGNLTSTTADLYFDDIAINGDSGRSDNWAGDGKIVHMHPNADGDNVDWSDSGANAVDYDEVDEVTPNENTDYIQTVTTSHVTDVNLEAASAAGITAGDSIKLLQVGARVRFCGQGAPCMTGEPTDSYYRVRLKAVASGTTDETSDIGILDSDPTNYYTNDDDGLGLPKLTSYDLPGATDYTPWTTDKLDTAQIGINNQGRFRATALWLLVEYNPASGGRLFSSGFELNSTTANMEWTSFSSGSISGSPARTGSYAYKTNNSGTPGYAAQTFAASNSAGPYYARAYFYVNQAISDSAQNILSFHDSGGTVRAYIRVAGSGQTLTLHDEDGQIGSASSALSTSTWYRIELQLDTSPTAGSHIVDARIDGVSFASSSSRSISTGVTSLRVGYGTAGGAAVPESTGGMAVDDVALNAGYGATQNSWPGAGSIIHVKPNGNGSNTAWTNDYTNVDEVTPDDATTLISETTTNDQEDYDLENVSLDGNNITLVSAGVRFNSSSATEEDFRVTLKNSSSSYQLESPILAPASTTWVTNQTASPFLYPLTAYTLPDVTTAWSDSTVDSAQIGVRNVGGSGTVQVSALWLLVEYAPPPPITVSGTIYSDEGSSVYNCSSDNLTIGVSVNGGTAATTTCTSAGGTYSVTVAANPSAADDPVVVWIDSGETPKATTATLAADTSSNITGLDLYQNRLITRSESATANTNAKLATGDNANAGIRYAVATGNLTVESGISLLVWTGDTYTPGGSVTTNVTGGDLKIASGATLSAGSNALSIGGSWTNSGTFTAGTSTTTFSSTATGKTLSGTLTGSTGQFYNVVFDGVSGGWTFSGHAQAANDFTVNNGAVTAGNNNLTVGQDFILANISGVSYSPGSGTVTVTRHFTDTGDKFTEGTSTVTHVGTGTITTAGNAYFYNVNVGAAGFVTTLSNHATNVSGVLSFNGGTVTGTGAYYSLRCSANCTPAVFNAATTLNGTRSIYFISLTGSITVTMAGGNYGNWGLIPYAAIGNSSTFQLGGTITTTGESRLEASDGITGSSFTTTGSNYGFTASSLQIAPCAPTRTGAWAVSLNDSTISLTSTATSLSVGTDCGSHTLNLGSSDITVSGSVAFVAGTGTIAVTPGSSDFTFAPAASQTETYASNGQSLWNMTINGANSAATIQPTSAVDVNNNFTITAGTYDTVTGQNYALTVGGSYSNSGTFTARSGTVTFDATTTGKTLTGTLSGGSAFYNLTFNGVGGAWSFGSVVDVTNDFTVTNGAVTANNNNLTVTRDFTLANTSGVSYASGSSTVTVSRHWTDTGLKHAFGTSTVVLNGTGTANSGSSNSGFYHVSVAYSGHTTTIQDYLRLQPGGVVTFNGGTVTGPANRRIYLSPNTSYTPIVFASPTTISNTAIQINMGGTGTTVTLPGGNYGSADIALAYRHNGTSQTGTVQLAGNITTTGRVLIGTQYATNNLVFNTANYSITAAGMEYGSCLGHGCSYATSTNFGSSTIDLGTSGIQLINNTGPHALDLGTSTVTSEGNIELVDGTGTINLTPGTSSVTMEPGASTTRTLTANSQHFYNFIQNGSSTGTVSLSGAVFADNDFTVTNGIFTTNNNSTTIGRDFTLANTSGVAFNAGSSTVTIGRDFNDLGDKLSAGTSSIVMNGTGNLNLVGSVYIINSISVAYGSFTTTLASGSLWVQGTVTLNGGTFTISGSNAVGLARSSSGTSLVFASPTTITAPSNGGFVFMNNAAGITQTMPGGDYGQAGITLQISRGGGTGNVVQMGGNITTTGTFTAHSYSSAGTTTGSFNTQNYNLSVASISFGHGSFTDPITMNFGSSVITASTTGTGLGVTNTVGGGNHTLNMGSSTLNLYGGMSFVSASNSITVDPGTSTVNWLHTSGTKTYAPNGQSLYNMTINAPGGTVQPNAAVVVQNHFTITAGTYDTVSGQNYALTIGGNFTNSGTFTARSGTVTFNDAAKISTISGTTTFYNFTSTTPLKELEFSSYSVNSDVFTINGAFTLTGTSGNEIQLRSSSTGNQWRINHQGTESVAYTVVTDSGCDPSSTDVNVATTSSSGGNNGVCWIFPLTLSGTVYDTDEVTEITTGPTVRVKVNGSGDFSAAANGSGVYSVNFNANNADTLTIYLDTNGGDQASLYTYASGANMTNVHLYLDRVTVRCHTSGGCGFNAADFDDYDKDQDSDIALTYSGGAATVDAGHTLSVRDILTQGGSAITTNGDLEIKSGATLTQGAGITVAGNYLNSGTFTRDSASAVTFSATSTGRTIGGTLAGSTGAFYNLVFNGSGGGWTLGAATEVVNDLTLTDGTLTAPASTLTVAGDVSRTSGAYTHNSGTLVLTNSATGTLAGDFTGSNALNKLLINGGGSTDITATGSLEIAATNAADAMAITAGTFTFGDSNGDTLTLLGGMQVATTAGQTGTFQTGSVNEGSTITVDINANTSTPTCANCIVVVGATSGAGTGTFRVQRNGVVRLNARSAATASDTGIEVESTGFLDVSGQQATSVTLTATDDLDTRETTLCANALFGISAFTNMRVQLTTGLAAGRSYPVTATTIDNTDCANNGHDSMVISSTASATETSTTVSGSGLLRTITLTTQNGIVTADGEHAGRYVHNLTTDAYFRIVSTDDVGAGTDTVTVMADPDSFALLTTGDDIRISDGIRAGDTAVAIDDAAITAHDGTTCAAAYGEAGEGYIHAKAGSRVSIKQGLVCGLGRAAAGKHGLVATGVNGAASNEGLVIEMSRILNMHTGVYLDGSSNNTVTTSYFGENSASSLAYSVQAGASLNSFSSNLVTGTHTQALYIAGSSESLSGNNLLTTGTAVELDGAVGALVSGNTISFSDTGVSSADASANRIIGNTILAPSVAGVFELDSASQVVSGNTIAGGVLGIHTEAAGTSNAYISGNLVYGQSANGIELQAGASVSGNTVRDLAGVGIELDLPSSATADLSDNQLFGTTVGLDILGTGTYNVRLGGETYGSGTANGTADVRLGSAGTYIVASYSSTFASGTEVSAGTLLTGTSLISYVHDTTAGSTKFWGNYSVPADVAETRYVESAEVYAYAEPTYGNRVTAAHAFATAVGGGGSHDTDIVPDAPDGSMGGSTESYVYQAICMLADCVTSRDGWLVYRNGTALTKRASTGDRYIDTQVDGGSAPNVAFTIDDAGTNYVVGDSYRFQVVRASGDTATAKIVTSQTSDAALTVASGRSLTLTGTGSGTVTLDQVTGTTPLSLVVDGQLTGTYAVVTVAGNVTGSGQVSLPSNSTFTLRASGANRSLGSTAGTADWVVDALVLRNADGGSRTISFATGGSGAIKATSFTVGNGSDAATVVDNETNDRVLDVGSVSITATGTLQASSTANFRVADDWTNLGTFTPGTGTVTLVGSTEATLVGATTFANLTIATPDVGPKNVLFPTAHIIGVTGTFTARSMLGKEIGLYSVSDGVSWNFLPTGTYNIDAVTIKDGGCETGAIVMNVPTSTNGGNNGVCWVFGSPGGSTPDTRAGSGTIRGGSGTIRVQ